MRYRRFLVSGELLVKISTEGWVGTARCIKGLPQESKFIYAYPAGNNWGIWIVVEHGSFDLLRDGDIIPAHETPEYVALPLGG